MGLNKAKGQSDKNQVLLFKILDTSGTPSITAVSPDYIPAADIVVTDTGTGDFSVAVKDFKGPRGLVNPQCTAETISTFASVASYSYSGDTLTIVIKVENDASSATDSSVYVRLEAF